MHGVSHKFVVNAFEVFGLAPFLPVKAQQDPDPEFPTVAFPNPEEKGWITIADDALICLFSFRRSRSCLSLYCCS